MLPDNGPIDDGFGTHEKRFPHFVTKSRSKGGWHVVRWHQTKQSAGNMVSIVLKNDEGTDLAIPELPTGTRPAFARWGLWCDGDGLRGAIVLEVVERYEGKD